VIDTSTEFTGDELPFVSTHLPGPRTQLLVDMLSQHECPGLTARRQRREEISGAAHDPIVWNIARRSCVTDTDGNRFVDMTSGFGAALLGHSHPAVIAALRTQSERMIHALGDVYPSDVKILLERRLASMAPWPARVILGLSGADAVEAALKTAMLHTKRPGVLAFEGSYHGLSYGTVAACGYKHSFRDPFAPQLNAHVHFAPFPNAHDFSSNARSMGHVTEVLARGDIGAVIIEPMLGRGGVVLPPDGFLRELGVVVHAAGAVLIVDEIYTGLYRTGPLFRSVAQGADPDIVCLGKALGGGVAISACLMRDTVATAWGTSVGEAIHTSTFLGNPLRMRAALASLDALETPEVQQQISDTSDHLADSLQRLAHTRELGIRSVTVVGLLAGITLVGGVARTLAVMRTMLERGYVVLPGGVEGATLTLTPPCTLTKSQCDHFEATLRSVLLSCS
jgi:4-aminobutyrate aminotransferase / (S)-3-amino-2-methylpropionate transaminase / 5-aminovalerate transaminase